MRPIQKREPITAAQAVHRREQDDEMLTDFVPLMRRELTANAWKGPIDGYSPVEAAEQLLYHAAKAARAILAQDPAVRAAMGIASTTDDSAQRLLREHCADVANEGAIAWFSLASDLATTESDPSPVGDDPGDPPIQGDEPVCRRCRSQVGTPHHRFCAYVSESRSDWTVALSETRDVPPPPGERADPADSNDPIRAALASNDADYEDAKRGPVLGGQDLAAWATSTVGTLAAGLLPDPSTDPRVIKMAIEASEPDIDGELDDAHQERIDQLEDAAAAFQAEHGIPPPTGQDVLGRVDDDPMGGATP